MRIDVFSDVVCPWCFVGKRRLEQALASAKATDAEVHWHAFQLNPDLPSGGVDRREYLESKFGPGAAERIHARLDEVGREAGIDFQFDKIGRSPNTRDAHRLLWLAGNQGKQSRLKEALMKAYFIAGRDIGDRAVLAEVAAAAGIAGDVQAFLASEGGQQEVQDDLATAARLQISGVPFFIFDGRYALAGAQPPEVFAQALEAARSAPARPIG
ncbi:MAG TPA: DsbA family oxidoreductase [Gammaproteobacteria bacterium]|nr:DsbA family oxidoreductase [Gammaproteobacteria bacterium]